MSIYSGFPTRHQQQTYDNLINDLIFVLQKRILKFYHQQHTQQIKFLDIVLHLHTQLNKMEQHKYLEPKTSKSIQQLLKYLVINTQGADQYLEHKKKQALNPIKHHKPTGPQIKSANTMLAKKALKSHRDSFSQLNEPTSVGKIVRQINGSHEQSMGGSRHKIFLNDNLTENFVNGVETPRNNNPQNHNNSAEHDNTSKKLGAYKSQNKRQKNKQSRPRDLLLQYLQKNNKNYLRGYRKRSVKTRKISTSGKTYNY